MYNSRTLFKDAAQFGSPVPDSDKLWKAFGEYVDETLRMGKGLKVPKFGFFTSIRSSHRDALQGIKGRVFAPAQSFCRSHGVTARKVGKFLFSPCLEFNMSKLASKAKMEKDVAKVTLELLLRTLGQAVAMGQNCRIVIDKVGTLIIQKRELSFRFQGYPEFMPIPEPPKWGVRSTGDLVGELDLPSSTGRSPRQAVSLNKKLSPSELDMHGGLQPEYGENSVSTSTLSLEGGSGDALDTMAQGLRMQEQLEQQQQHPHHAAPLSRHQSPAAHESARTGSGRSMGEGSSFVTGRPLTMGGFMERSHRRPAADTISVFPNLQSTQVTRPRKGAQARSINLTLAYERLEHQLLKEKLLEEKREAEIQQRLDLSTKVLAERKQRQKSKQDELNQFLRTQAEQHRQIRARQRLADKAQPPSPEKAYPVEKRLDVEEERQVKQSLRDFLDQQVRLKQEQEAQQKAKEKERDQFLLQCMEQEASLDASFRRRKVQEDQKALVSEWTKQQALCKQGQSLYAKLV